MIVAYLAILACPLLAIACEVAGFFVGLPPLWGGLGGALTGWLVLLGWAVKS